MADAKNNAIYLEADEDITSAIDKLIKSSNATVQVVAAKRSTLIQSKTNLRLLKKSADDAGKKLVLITSDRVATNLASRIGLPVASQVGEVAHVPAGPTLTHADDEVMSDESTAPIAPIATAAAAVTAAEAAEEIAPVVAPKPTPPPAAMTRTPITPPMPKDKRVPNFSKLQKRALWIGGGLVAIIALLGANYYIASAKVTLYAKADQVPASFNFTADPSASDVNTASAIIPATQMSIQKSLTGVVQATGKKDNGTKATGTMTISNTYDANSHPLVTGTRFIAADGKVFRSTADTSVPGATPTIVNGHLGLQPGQAKVPVQADQNGDAYNEGPGKYSIPGLSADQQSGITAQGSQMQGGSSKITPVIDQSDIDKTKAAVLTAAKNSIQGEFNAKAGKNQRALDATLQENDGAATTNPDAGAEAQSANFSIQVTFTELSVDRTKLSQLTKAVEQKQVGNGNQIYDDGSSTIKITAGKTDGAAGAAQSLHAEATSYAGGRIDKGALAKQLKGKKYGEAADLATQLPGVDRAEVSISPSWQTAMPGIVSHIHITIRVASQSK